MRIIHLMTTQVSDTQDCYTITAL